MTKELEALEKVRNCLYPWAYDNQKAFDIIEAALKENKQDYDMLKEEYALYRKDTEKQLKALEIIKELIFKDLVFDDKEQEINFSFGISTLCIKIKDKTKYDLLKEGLL